MTTDLETRLRENYLKLADEVHIPTMTFEDLFVERCRPVGLAELEARRPERTRHGRSWLLVAASAVLVVAGVATLAPRRDGGDTDGPSTPVQRTEPTPLSAVDDVLRSEWIIATSLPADLEWLYPYAPPDAIPDRIARYGTERDDGQSTEQLEVSVGGRSSVPEGEDVEISGTTWTVSAWTPGQWTATRQLASSTVTVSDTGVFDDADSDLLAGLVVVPEDGLPSPVLGDPGRAIDVARYELDGVTHTLAVQESNGFWCTWVRSEGGYGGGCGTSFGAGTPITIDGGSTTNEGGSDLVEVERGGSVSADVARVEVEFGGGVISVVPSDESGLFDRKFWIVAARFDGPAEPGRPSLATLIEVRAYDSQDQLLGTEPPVGAGL